MICWTAVTFGAVWMLNLDAGRWPIDQDCRLVAADLCWLADQRGDFIQRHAFADLPELLSPQCFPRDGRGRRRAGCVNRHFIDHDFMTGLIQTESEYLVFFRGTSVVGEDVDDHGVFAPQCSTD
jgi:hypothetical protein